MAILYKQIVLVGLRMESNGVQTRKVSIKNFRVALRIEIGHLECFSLLFDDCVESPEEILSTINSDRSQLSSKIIFYMAVTILVMLREVPLFQVDLFPRKR